MLIILGGLPGAGKSAIARELARQLGAVDVRIDSIEQALRESGLVGNSVPMNDAGYRVAYAVAEDNLRVGRRVIADSFNPIPLTRQAWIQVAQRAQVTAVEIEITCSDAIEHRQRVEARAGDIVGLRLSTWHEVVLRDYRPWEGEHLVIDTAGRSVEQSVSMIRKALGDLLDGHT